SSAVIRFLGTRRIAITFRMRNGPFIGGVFHAVPDHNTLCPRGYWFWRRRWRRGRRLYLYRGGDWRYRVWHGSWTSEVIFRYATNWVDFGLCWLTQYECESSHVCCQQDFLSLFSTDLESDRLSNRRLFGPFAGNLVNGEDLGVLQDHIRVSLLCF